MGKLRDEALKKDSEDVKSFSLTDEEINYIKLLNMVLTYHTFGNKILSGFLYYVSTNRLGYPSGTDLQFELDLEKEDNMLTIKLLPVPPVDK